jgi:hypothetical protein
MTERYTDGFSASLVTAITSTTRPVTFDVSVGSAQLPSGNFAILIYDVGTDANPTNAERLVVTTVAGGGGVTWTASTETTDTAKTHAAGSTVRQIVTARSMTQQMTDHTDPITVPDPHTQYMRKASYVSLGDLMVGTGAATFARLALGTDGQVLSVDHTTATGFRFVSSSSGLSTSVLTTPGDILYRAFNNIAARNAPSSNFDGTLPNYFLSLATAPAAIANPASAPTLAASAVAMTSPAFAASTTYHFKYAWFDNLGSTMASPDATFTEGASPTSIAVTAPAAPTAATGIVIYAGTTSTNHQQLFAINGGLSTTGTNTYVMNNFGLFGALPQTVNNSGGLVPSWLSMDNGSVTMPDVLGKSVLVGRASAPFTTVRFRGALGTAGPPSSTFDNVGDTIYDSNGVWWRCVVAGSPGGTWIPISPLTSRGDLLVASATGVPVRLGIGTTGQVLSSNGVDPVWSAPTGGSGGGGGGGSGALVPIQVIPPLTVAQATLAFTAPQTGFRNLRLVISGRGTAAANNVTVGVQFNGDTGANYDYTTSNFAASSGSGGAQATAATSAQIAWLAAASSSAGISSGADVFIRNYRGTDLHKEFSGVGSLKYSTTPLLGNPIFAGFWRNTAAINSILLTPSSGSFDVGTYACLYGEMDTPGPLLTPASNLLAETVLSATQPDITITNISQAYRDLRIEVVARCDNASAQNLLLRLNGDSAANYDWDQEGSTAGAASAQTGIRVGVAPGTGTTANRAEGGSITIPAYTGTTFQKAVTSLFYRPDNNSAEPGGGIWKNTAAVTSITIVPAAGNLIAGSVVRITGEPASAGGAAVGTGTRVRISTNQAIATATATAMTADVEDSDADNQHFTLATAITGTVAKTAASQTLAGTGTAFLTELNIGQVIVVPGTANEKAVVIAIASNTSLTVAKPFVNTATGQTATRVNSAITFRQPGSYSINFGAYMAAIASGSVSLQIKLNDATFIAQADIPGVNASAGYNLHEQRPFQQWDFIEAYVTQSTGGSVNLLADERTHLAVNARPTVIVAIPYAQVQERQTSGTNGGGFTSGAWQPRVLNTVVKDSAGLVTLASNTITLPPGSYRARATAPAFKVDRHQLRLQNTTDAVTLLTGTSSNAFAFGNVGTVAELSGQFVLSGSKSIQLQHQCQTTEATDGFGVACSFGTEVYAGIEIWKEG